MQRLDPPVRFVEEPVAILFALAGLAASTLTNASRSLRLASSD